MNLWFSEASDIELIITDLEAEVDGVPEPLAGPRILSEAITSKIMRSVDGENRAGIGKDEWRWFFAWIFEKVRRDVQFNDRREFFINLLLTKHRNYGTQSLNRWREVGIASRIDQKLARLDSLSSQKSIGTADETIEDTVFDILGYCVLGMYIANKAARTEP